MLSHTMRKVWLPGRFVPPPGTGRARAGGYVWQVLPAGAAAFGPAGPDLAGWIAAGIADVVKAGPQRTVFRVDLPAGPVFVKRCRVNTPRAWAREILRPAKAKLEFENAVTLRRLGVPAVEPLAWGARHHLFPGESVVVTRCHAAEPLEVYLARGDFPRVPLAVELGTFLARLHDAGVSHPDPHPGNFLVASAGGRPAFRLIDLHAIRFGRPLGWEDSLANLVLINRWFQLRAGRSDRARFWAAYAAGRHTLPEPGRDTLAAMAKSVEARTHASNARFWTARLGRYAKSNRQYRRVGRGNVRGYAVRDLPPTFLESLLADPDAVFAGRPLLKDSPSSTVAAITVNAPLGDRDFIAKRFRAKSLVHRLKDAVRTPAAVRSWLFGHNLLDRGLPTARPVCVLRRRRGLLPAEAYLVTETVPDALELPAAVAAAAGRPDVIRGWAGALGRLVRDLHDREVSHRDLKAPNILMAGAVHDLGTATAVLIDLVGVRVGSAVSFATRVKNLARLNASFPPGGVVTRTDKLRFLRAYGSWGLCGKAGWKAWWAAADAGTRAKAAKNARAGRPLA